MTDLELALGIYSALTGFKVVVDQVLVGCKKGYKMGDTIHLSPAMMDLLKHAETQEELTRLLTAIELVDLGPKFEPHLDFTTVSQNWNW